MARRKARIPQGKKIQPAPMTMTFDLDTAPGAGDYRYIDLSQCASLINRRFYRQGLNWAVAGFTWYTQTAGTMTVSKVPDTWVASNAWHKGFAAWQEMNNQALEETESVKPKFLDFKVYMDAQHASDGSAANLIPRYSPGNDYTKGEWEYSSIHVPYAVDTSAAGADTMREFELIWTGASFPGAGASGHDSVSLIEGYAASRALPDIVDPNVPDDAADTAGTTPENWLTAMFNEGTTQSHEVLEDMITENNLAPYPFENDGTNTDTQYPGGANQAPGSSEHSFGFVTATTVGGQTQLNGGNFQGGLIKIHLAHEGSSLLQVHLVPGPHRGYMCQPMQDV